jgi:hypothetical protein
MLADVIDNNNNNNNNSKPSVYVKGGSCANVAALL